MPNYPLMQNASETLQASSGRPLSEITLDALEDLSIADVQISPAALRAQAEIARQAGFRQLATNLTRAAELTAVPNAELLRMYELLRPQRAGPLRLDRLAHEVVVESAHAKLALELIRDVRRIVDERRSDLHVLGRERTLAVPGHVRPRDEHDATSGRTRCTDDRLDVREARATPRHVREERM